MSPTIYALAMMACGLVRGVQGGAPALHVWALTAAEVVDTGSGATKMTGASHGSPDHSGPNSWELQSGSALSGHYFDGVDDYISFERRTGRPQPVNGGRDAINPAK